MSLHGLAINMKMTEDPIFRQAL